MLVHVTGFFRDPTVFDALVTAVVPRLSTARPLRAWAIGAASGEETWSLCAALLAASGLDVEVQASDRDPLSLETASAGEYSEAALVDGAPATRTAMAALFEVSRSGDERSSK